MKDVLGEGGMGVVYGEQSHPEREVAIKRLKKQNPYMRFGSLSRGNDHRCS